MSRATHPIPGRARMMPTAPSSDDRAFVVQLAEFSGPLDLLLTLIRDQEIDITDIPIAQIADQFVAAIHQLGLNQAADYLEMAARLLRIKVQMLLPPLDTQPRPGVAYPGDRKTTLGSGTRVPVWAE